MEWWQILLIGIASIVVGILLGALSSYLFKRFVKKRETTLVYKAAPVPETTPARETTLAIEEKIEGIPPGLLEEIESNLKLAREPQRGTLLPFKTRMWDEIQGKVDNIPASLQEGLSQVYIDIRLANSIVRLSSDFDHRTYSLNEHYMKLCTSIAEKLDRLKPLMERPAK